MRGTRGISYSNAGTRCLGETRRDVTLGTAAEDFVVLYPPLAIPLSFGSTDRRIAAPANRKLIENTIQASMRSG